MEACGPFVYLAVPKVSQLDELLLVKIQKEIERKKRKREKKERESKRRRIAGEMGGVTTFGVLTNQLFNSDLSIRLDQYSFP